MDKASFAFRSLIWYRHYISLREQNTWECLRLDMLLMCIGYMLSHTELNVGMAVGFFYYIREDNTSTHNILFPFLWGSVGVLYPCIPPFKMCAYAFTGTNEFFCRFYVVCMCSVISNSLLIPWFSLFFSNESVDRKHLPCTNKYQYLVINIQVDCVIKSSKIFVVVTNNCGVCFVGPLHGKSWDVNQYSAWHKPGKKLFSQGFSIKILLHRSAQWASVHFVSFI